MVMFVCWRPGMHFSSELCNFNVYIGCHGSLIGLYPLDAQVPKVLAGLVHSRCDILYDLFFRKGHK